MALEGFELYNNSVEASARKGLNWKSKLWNSLQCLLNGGAFNVC